MELHNLQIQGTGAPYGHACLNCSRAKCKCIFPNLSGSCERCRRLNKECRPSLTVRKRNAKRPTASKTAKLEEKLDDIVSLLKSATKPGTIAVDSTATAAGTFEHDNNTQTSSTNSSDPTLLTPEATGSESTSCESPASAANCAIGPSTYEAEEYLEIFRAQKSKYFPFVYIPSTTSAQQLLQVRPFLWICIMAISSKSTSQQLTLGNQIRQELGQKMLNENEKSLDLLLGLLAYVGWANYQIHNKPSLSVFTQLAVSLIFDLGLNKPIPNDTDAMLSFKCHGWPKPSPPSNTRTMEERRAVLGCFLVSSIISSSLQKIDALRWTPYMDECLQILAEKQEYSTDEILVQQVRLQLIVEKLAQTPLHDGEPETAALVQAPPAFYLGALRSCLQDVKQKIPLGSQRNEVVLAHLHSTELTVNEIALSRTPIVSNSSDFQRFESLYTCLNSIKSWFDVFFTIPPSEYIGFSYSMWSQLLHCLIVLYRLSTLDDPFWDKNLVRNTANLPLILDQLANRLEHVNGLTGLDNDSTEVDLFTKANKLIASVKLGWEAKLAAQPMGSTVSTRLNVDGAFPEALSMDFSDDAWLTDILVSWDC